MLLIAGHLVASTLVWAAVLGTVYLQYGFVALLDHSPLCRSSRLRRHGEVDVPGMDF